MPERDSAGRTLNWWGIASVVLMIGGYAAEMYGVLSSTGARCELCVVVQLAAGICGIIAIRRGSLVWMWTVIPSLFHAFQCFLCEI